jgi:hypothetical protein
MRLPYAMASLKAPDKMKAPDKIKAPEKTKTQAQKFMKGQG